MTYLKRSFEEKSFHFFYWSSIIIQEYSYNKFFIFFVFCLYNKNNENQLSDINTRDRRLNITVA